MNTQEALPGLAIIKTSSKQTNMYEQDATSKQVEFILSLSKSRVVSHGVQGVIAQQQVDSLNAGKSISKDMASKLITHLLTAPKLPVNSNTNPRAENTMAIGVGFYKMGTRVFKAVKSPQTGNMYTKELTPEGWMYLTGGISLLKNNTYTKLTLDEAKYLGKIYGFCVACGRTLTDETSIANGIGPICESKF